MSKQLQLTGQGPTTQDTIQKRLTARVTELPLPATGDFATQAQRSLAGLSSLSFLN